MYVWAGCCCLCDRNNVYTLTSNDAASVELTQVTSQHPYAEDFIGEPHVFTVDMNDRRAVETAVQSALSAFDNGQVTHRPGLRTVYLTNLIASNLFSLAVCQERLCIYAVLFSSSLISAITQPIAMKFAHIWCGLRR